MLQIAIVMLGAGLAGMLLFVVSAKGSLAAVLVTYFTPLPIMIAALGWGQTVGLAAGLLGAFIIAVMIQPALGLIYAAAFALPAWWLAYLSLLARFAKGAAVQPAPVGGVQREWYPLGRVVVWAALIGCGVAIVGVLSVSITNAGFEFAARSFAVQMVPVIETLFGAKGLPNGVSAEDIAAVLIKTIPVAASASLTLLLLVNLWLAGRTVELSHRLPRPWPNLPENLRLPRPLLVIFPIVVVAAAVLDDYASLFAAIIAAALGVALTLQGLAVVHVVTRRRPGRTAILMALYATLLMLMPWSAILLTIVGLLDLAVSLRDRFAVASSSPPRT